MKHARTIRRLFTLPLAIAAVATAQMHKVAAPDQVTRAVGVYEYVGDPLHPKAARLIPVSLFIGGHFEDAGVYLARPVPFALGSGLRYELQQGGVLQNFLDLIAARNFTNSAAAAAQSFDDGWFGYGRVVAPKVAKAGKLKPNCGNARVVQETDTAKKDDGKPHFGSRPAATDDAQKPASGRIAAPDPCREDPDSDRPERVALANDTSPKDKDAPDPERPTLHRSPETTANNTGSNGKPDKKAPKPPPATVTANASPADDPDRPTIRHRTTDEDDPNALPPDPVDLASREAAKAAVAKADGGATAAAKTPARPASPGAAASTNDTVEDGATISSGSTMTGGPVLRRGRVSAPPPDPSPVAKAADKPVAPAKSTAVAARPGTIIPGTATNALAPSPTIPAPLDSFVAVSDAKERTAHDFHYKFANTTERATVLNSLEEMARAVLANPSLATDAPSGAVAGAKAVEPTAPARTTAKAGTRTASTARTTNSRATARSRTTPKPAPAGPPAFADEEMNAYQLYFSAPVTYTFTARMPATDSTPERYVTIVAQTDAEGRLQPAMRSLTDTAHLDRTPRYRLIDVVDADGSNRASLLMELRMQHSRQFALYRLLGNRPDQIFVSGSTLL